jgi:hypothetical protein
MQAATTGASSDLEIVGALVGAAASVLPAGARGDSQSLMSCPHVLS